MTGDGAATVRLHREFYSAPAIAAATATFADFARFSTAADGEYTVVQLSEIDRDVDGDVVAEFCNFALANSAAQRRSENA